MRYVVLDTETTGLEWREGHRIIEIGCVELLNRQVTSNHFHQYINPQREVDAGAFEVHGISNDMLADKPVFKEVVSAFLKFIEGAVLIIHNAPFDLGFLDYELSLLNLPSVKTYVAEVIDSLVMARGLFPGKRNNLDALCDRLGVRNSHRTLHGALLDAEILGEVYLAMTRGQEQLLSLEEYSSSFLQQECHTTVNSLAAFNLIELKATVEELTLHHAYLKKLEQEAKLESLWSQRITSQSLQAMS